MALLYRIPISQFELTPFGLMNAWTRFHLLAEVCCERCEHVKGVAGVHEVRAALRVRVLRGVEVLHRLLLLLLQVELARLRAAKWKRGAQGCGV